MDRQRLSLPDRIAADRPWQWIDWSLFGLYLFWIATSAIYVAGFSEVAGDPKWPAVTLFLISSLVPLLFWRPSHIWAEWFIASEIIGLGSINLIMHFSAGEYVDNMVLATLLAGYLATARSVRWSAPILILFPLIGLFSGKLSVPQAVDQSVNHFVLYGIGIGFNLLIHTQSRLKQLLQDNERQYRVIRQYAEQVERLTLQEERSRVAAELHDAIGHAHVSLVMGLETVQSAIARDPGQAQQRLASLLEHARASFGSIRSHIHGLAPAEGEELAESLSRITEQLQENTGIAGTFAVEGERLTVPSSHRLLLIRCAQEAITNAVKHGHARQVDCLLTYTKDEVAVLVRDDGQGAEQLEPGFGLSSMRERLQAYGGSLDICSEREAGTSVRCALPLSNMPLDKGERPIRLLIADDEQLVRESLHFLFGQEDGIEVIGTASHGKEVLALLEREPPDVLLMDVRMPEMDGLACTKKVKACYPQVKVILITTVDEVDLAMAAIEAGAEGYLLKSIHPRELLASVRMLYQGGTLVDQAMARTLIAQMKRLREREARDIPPQADAAADPFGLTEREREVLDGLAQGLKYRQQIAERLYLSEGTVRNYISTLYAKLGVRDRQSAANVGREAGLLRDGTGGSAIPAASSKP
ncbi:hybrid sensor histidine kinase/response regulator transcription factor [Paenibacillus thiaminolyticus]|uniref:Response regulator n=1 Tax=Paenibacillus thiaminolyticus TaxID=49283 RepID=A0AAP9DTL8_PANTH|nr:hybrid sensor histidine kinase/response regulator transcription factor [Paenibacillus thiaminolyticus]MCY9537441.1 hybrid sensor histidine kinase/response regulator transcription factor [Paenibacillus thiaminolyticus]MCY9601128.1 hybrid sensor histidine kinase/response regulator transcription factor [Paenibacillus thiaminolyticus]MCY9607450.1 hybrid sensor histidine kinase/response regulator transcription factor [Paenibacillus thiaminolyticus]MCY9613153.1 hybrid sensor histidine kinase/respo